MTITVGINGFGRIGRSYFRALLATGADIRVAAVNDLTSAQTLANLLKYDSVYGPLPQPVVAEGSSIRVGDTVVEVLSERDPAQLPTPSDGLPFPATNSTSIAGTSENRRIG